MFRFEEDEMLDTMIVIITRLDGKKVDLLWTSDRLRASLSGISLKANLLVVQQAALDAIGGCMCVLGRSSHRAKTDSFFGWSSRLSAAMAFAIAVDDGNGGFEAINH